MYATMNSKAVTEGKLPVTKSALESDMKSALTDGKHLILVLRRHPFAIV